MCGSVATLTPRTETFVQLHRFVLQSIRRHRRRVLAACKTEIELGDEGPYQSLVEALKALCAAIKPRSVPSKTRRRAAMLKSILKGVFERIKECARRKYGGVAQLLRTEISGHGGLSIFRRLDAACVANERAVPRAGPSGPVPRVSGGGPSRGPRGRAPGQRGRGGSRRDTSNVTCYGCYGRGHFQADCPVAGGAAPAAK